MKKLAAISGIGLLGAALVVGLWIMSGYNGLIDRDEQVKQAWSEVENTYQRRLDLIPNLVETVKGAAEFEKSTFTEVAEARARAGDMRITADMLDDPQVLARFEQAQAALTSALSRLLVTVERYPELKANANFVRLQDELAGTENRIAVARRRFNEVVQQYNVRVQRFPTRMIAGFFGFEQRAYFQADRGAEKAPRVEF